MKKVFILAGPTGGGKTSIVSRLDPEKFEIVSFDSRQIYRFLEWGTAKPSLFLREQIFHHLVDFLDPSEKLDAKKFSELAEKSVLSILDKGKTPVLTCGTGFYLKAFLYGMFPVPKIREENLREVELLTPLQKWQELLRLDPRASEKLHESDEYRVTRALTINREGVKWSELENSPRTGFLSRPEIQWKGIFLDWERKVLYERIDKRAREILESGLLEETEFVIRKFGKDCPGLSSLGYNFVIEFLEGKIDRETLLEKFSQSHRNYAKKQITWFRGEKILESCNFFEVEQILEKFISDEKQNPKFFPKDF